MVPVGELTRSAIVVNGSDEERRAGLRRMRIVATSLLVLAAVIFVLTHGHHGVWGYVNAASEAAMVGAVADWFAVTALFRHPLGLPIPHTAIIQERKDTIARSLEDFVTDNFLTADNVKSRLASAQVARRVGAWLGDPAHADRVVAESAPALGRAIGSIRDSEVRELLDKVLLPRLKREEVSPLLGHLLEGVVQDRSHVGFVDLAVRELHAWVAGHQQVVTDLVRQRAPWWSPTWVDEQVSLRIYQEILNWLQDVRDDPDHRMRQSLDEFLQALAGDLQHNPETMANAERLKEHLLEHPSVSTSLVSLWGSVRIALADALADPDGELRARMARALVDLGNRLENDPAWRDAADRRVADAVGHLVSTYGREITTVISETIERWDGQEASQKIELHVGRDLQFIRINGTVVGGLVGLIIYSIAQFL